MSVQRRTWFVIANCHRARIVVLGAAGDLFKTLWCADAMEAGNTCEPVSANPRDCHPKLARAAPTGRFESDARWDKVRFGWHLAKLLNESRARQDFDALVLVAPSPILRSIREGLDPLTSICIVAEAAKDLTDTPDSALAVRFSNEGDPIGSFFKPEGRPIS